MTPDQQQDLAEKQGFRNLYVNGYIICRHEDSGKYILPGSTKENPVLVDELEARERYMGLEVG